MKKYLFYLLAILITSCQDEIIPEKPNAFERNQVIYKFKWSIDKPKTKLIYPFSELNLKFSQSIKQQRWYTGENGKKTVFRKLDTSSFIIFDKEDNRFECTGFKITSNNSLKLFLPEGLSAKSEAYIYIKMNYFELKDEKLSLFLDKNNKPVKDSLRIDFSTNNLPKYIKKFKQDKFEILDTIEFTKGINPIITSKYKNKEILICTLDGLYIDSLRANIGKAVIFANEQKIASNSIPINENSFYIAPNNIYKKDAQYKVRIEASWEVKKDGKWLNLSNIDKDYSPEILEKDIDIQGIFTNKLSSKIISHSYPSPNLFNFYQLEYPKGYLKFRFNVNDIAQIDTDDIYFSFYKYPFTEKLIESKGEISQDNRSIWFDMPQRMKNETVYRIDVISKGKIIHVINFRTSKYNMLVDKLTLDLNAKFIYNVTDKERNRNCSYLGVKMYTHKTHDEGFYGDEIIDNTESDLIRITPLIDKWDWYNNSIYKYIYDNPQIFKKMVKRPLNEVPFPPFENIFSLWQINFDRELSESEIENNSFVYEIDFTHIINKMPYYLMQDYHDIRMGLLQEDNSLEGEEIDFIKNNRFTGVGNGKCPVSIEYRLPGQDISSSTCIMNITKDL